MRSVAGNTTLEKIAKRVSRTDETNRVFADEEGDLTARISPAAYRTTPPELQVMDDGHLTDSQGTRVDFRNTLLMLTSNLGICREQCVVTVRAF